MGPRRRRGQYREHDAWVKDLVALSGKWDLFPDLEIPRTTAESWIDKGYQGYDEKLGAFAEHFLDRDRELANLKESVELLRAQLRLMTEAQDAFGFALHTKKIRSPESRNKILLIIEKAIEEKVPRSVCLSTLGMTRSRYKRWRREQK